MLEYKLHIVNRLEKANHNGYIVFFLVVLVTCRSPLNHIEVDS